MRDGLSYGESFNALLSPLGTDLVAGNPPNLFCVGLEKCLVELAAKSIDEEVLEVLNSTNRERRTAKIADANLERTYDSEFLQGVCGELDGIVEELTQEVDPRLPGSNEHDAMFFVEGSSRRWSFLDSDRSESTVASGFGSG